MSKQRKKGTSFETAVVEYLATATGQNVERRALHGAQDKGDISGFTVNGQPCVIECKNCRSYELAQWVDEANREADAADAEYGVVVFHRNRVGLDLPRMGGQFVLMDLSTFCGIVRGTE